MNFIILGVFRKMNIFGGIKILWIFLGHHNLDYICESFLCILGSFPKINVKNGGIFGGC